MLCTFNEGIRAAEQCLRLETLMIRGGCVTPITYMNLSFIFEVLLNRGDVQSQYKFPENVMDNDEQIIIFFLTLINYPAASGRGMKLVL